MIQILTLLLQCCYGWHNYSVYIFAGAYTPLTMEGNILVDGILASCYASFDHELAHVVMKPLLWFPSIMNLLFGEEKSTQHTYAAIWKHIGGMMSLQ